MSLFRSRSLIAILVCLVSVSDAACGDTPASPSAVTSLKISGPSTIAPGATAAYKALLYYSDGSSMDVTASTTWTSSAPEVVDVQPGGMAVGRARGEVTIGAKQAALGSTLGVLVLEDGTFKLSGRVTEPGANVFQGIFGAVIEVVGGVGAGLQTTTTDFTGSYVLYGVAGDVRLRVSADGYAPNTIDVAVTRATHRVIELTPIAGPAGNLAGKWVLTISANPSCSTLPESARSRQFLADISHSESPRVAARLSSPSLSHADTLIGQVIANEITLPLPYWPGDIVDGVFYSLIDSLKPRGALGIRGTLRFTFDGSSATGVLDGAVDYYPAAVTFGGGTECAGRTPATLRREGS